MAKSTKKEKYPVGKSKTNKVKEPLIEGLDVKELVIDPSSEENFILPKSQSQIDTGFGLVKENVLQAKFLSNTLLFFYSLNKHLGESGLVILPSIYSALATASELKILKGTLEDLNKTYWKRIDLILKGEFQRAKHWGLTFFLLLYEETSINQSEEKEFPFLKFLDNLTYQLTRVKDGEKSINVVIEVISKSEESQNFLELKSFLESVNGDHFISLSKIYDRLIDLLDKVTIKEEKLNYWRQIIKAFCFVLINSTKTPEMFISELKDNPSLIKNELQGILIAYFICKLYYDKPYEKTIPIVFLDNEKMKTIFPLSESLINYKNIIESSRVAKINLEEYFWTYVWGKPYSMFEKPEVKEVKKFQKKLIEVEEEVIVEEKNFGDFIKIYGEAKPTGFIKLKTYL
jgi:hypothetical protein